MLCYIMVYMAELSQNDVQRAVTDATRDLRDAISRMSQQLNNLQSLENQVSMMRRDIENMRRQVNATNIQVSNLMARPVVTSAIDPRMWQQLGNNIHAINSRLVVMQKYLQEVSDYIVLVNDRNENEADDDADR